MSGSSVISPERRIELNSFDIDAWNLLLRESQTRPIEQSRDFYEKLVTQFPNAGRYWKAYIEHELRGKNFESVEKLFSRCLVHVLNIDLWKCYVHYVRETKGHLSTFREKMAQAYDFALEKVGLDQFSASIYSDYISFLKTVPAIGQYAENQRISAVRKVFQRAIATPMLNIEQLWSDYCTYEKSVNPTLAEKLIAERNKEYQVSKRISKSLEQVTRGINRQAVSVPPRGTATEMKQVEMWKKYIQWEKENPTETEEYAAFAKRVIYAYEQALLSLGYYPDIWYEASLFMQLSAKTLEEKGDVKMSQQMNADVIQLFERATGAQGLQRDSQLLFYAYADFQEERMKFDEVKKIYDKVLEMENLNPTLTYIQLMKMVRRTEGVAAARRIFKRAREDPRSKFHVFVAAGLMEYYCSKDKNVAMRVFDLGLKKYGDDPEYALAYVDFLTHLNEDNNTRVVFERILTSGTMPEDKSTGIWDKYLEFESLIGDLSSTLKVDSRRREALKDEDANTLMLIDRYRFLNLTPCTSDQLKLMGYKKMMSGGTGTVSLPSANSSNRIIPSAASAVMGGGSQGVKLELGGYPRPDTEQMIPFKPKPPSTAIIQTYPGGVFAPPPAVQTLLQILPPPWSFTGPFVKVDQLMELLKNYAPKPIPGVDINAIIEASTKFGSMKGEDVKKDFQTLLNTTQDPHYLIRQQKRRRANSDSDDEKDIYKRRMKQQNRQATKEK